jgi:predicted DNA-binding protein
MRVRLGKKDNLTRVAVRLPERLYQELSQLAATADRSLNYEIKVRLEASRRLDEILDAGTTNEALELINRLRCRLRDLRIAKEE